MHRTNSQIAIDYKSHDNPRTPTTPRSPRGRHWIAGLAALALGTSLILFLIDDDETASTTEPPVAPMDSGDGTESSRETLPLALPPPSSTGESTSGDETADIKYQCHGAVPEDGRPGQSIDTFEVRFQTLDNHLLLAEQLVDEQSDLLAVMFHNHQKGILQTGIDRLDIKQFVQANDRNVVFTQFIHLSASRD